eukprot:m.120730 g.120730  ORF g.120730 m.120730 type:complete len:76 (+) comp11065_c1_seq1:548-775(+)
MLPPFFVARGEGGCSRILSTPSGMIAFPPLAALTANICFGVMSVNQDGNGSAYLSTKVNEAKDILLKKRKTGTRA